MNARWIKLWRDARAASGRVLLAVCALAAGVAAVTVMLAAWAVLTREVPRNYAAIHAASAQLQLTHEPSAVLLERLRARADLAGVETAATLSARAEVKPGEWMPLTLFIVGDFKAAHIQAPLPEAGAWPAPEGALLLERSALPLSQAPIGAPLVIELPHAGRRSLPIAGTVHDPGLAPAWQEQTLYAYTTATTLRALGEPVALDVLKLAVAQEPMDRSHIEQVARSVASWLGAEGDPVLEARIPPPGRHPHQSQMTGVLAMLLGFSLLAMLLAAVLAGAVVGGLLAQQVRQIAIMKAVGARSSQIAAMYCVFVLVMGAAGVIAGLPLGLWLGQALVRAIAQLLNLTIASWSIPWWLFADVAMLGLLTPLLAAAWPVQRAVRRTVRAALDDHGVSSDVVHGRLARSVARLQIADPSLNIALRNMVRRRGRLAFTVLLLAGAGGMFITSLNLKAGWEQLVTQATQDRRFDVEVRLAKACDRATVLAAAQAVPGARIVEPWAEAEAGPARSDGLAIVHRYPDGVHGGLTLRAAPPDTRLIAHAMDAGRWLRPDDDGSVVLNTIARGGAFRNVRVGDTLQLEVEHRAVTLRVVGLMRELLTPGAAYVVPATFERLTGLQGQTTALRVGLADRSRTEAFTGDLVRHLESAGVPVKSVLTEQRFVAAQGGHVYILVFALGIIAVAMAAVGLLGLAAALGTAVTERLREFGVMRALGASTRAVNGMVIGEGVLVAVASVLVSMVAATLLSSGVANVLGAISAQPPALEAAANSVLLWMAMLLPASAAVSWTPARQASSAPVRDVLCHV